MTNQVSPYRDSTVRLFFTLIALGAAMFLYFNNYLLAKQPTQQDDEVQEGVYLALALKNNVYLTNKEVACFVKAADNIVPQVLSGITLNQQQKNEIMHSILDFGAKFNRDVFFGLNAQQDYVDAYSSLCNEYNLKLRSNSNYRNWVAKSNFARSNLNSPLIKIKYKTLCIPIFYNNKESELDNKNKLSSAKKNISNLISPLNFRPEQDSNNIWQDGEVFHYSMLNSVLNNNNSLKTLYIEQFLNPLFAQNLTMIIPNTCLGPFVSPISGGRSSGSYLKAIFIKEVERYSNCKEMDNFLQQWSLYDDDNYYLGFLKFIYSFYISELFSDGQTSSIRNI